MNMLRMTAGVLLMLCGSALASDAAQPAVFTAHDSLKATADPNDDAEQCLAQFRWQRQSFSVRYTPSEQAAWVYFASPLPQGDASLDEVALEWYKPADSGDAPAVLVVHESGRRQAAARAFARGLQTSGLHAFLIHMPTYGPRIADGVLTASLDELIIQAAADVRRASDAVAVLPGVDGQRISAVGISLGGFVISMAGALDGSFHSVFIMLAGGGISDILQTNAREVVSMRRQFAGGTSTEELAKLLHRVEPLRLAHRLNPERTWIISATQDEVVPLENAVRLAESAGLYPSHHIQLPGNHYSVALFAPLALRHIVRRAGEVAPDNP